MLENEIITKGRWVDIMRAAGLSDDDMHNCHSQFERLESECHTYRSHGFRKMKTGMARFAKIEAMREGGFTE